MWTPVSRFSELRESAGSGKPDPVLGGDREWRAQVARELTGAPVDPSPRTSDLPRWSRWPNCPGPLRGWSANQTTCEAHPTGRLGVTPDDSEKIPPLRRTPLIHPQRKPAGQTSGGSASNSLCFRALVGGRQEARTPDLRVANAALSQLS